MDGPSSEARYDLNIRTAEILSCSRSKSNINLEAVEATQDSNEICVLEKKECDKIMDHLKNNPGLVVKSLGSEGQTILHVAVMTGETKKPNPPTPKPTDEGLTEAANDSEWYDALENQDCKALMALLEANPSLMVQTGSKGLTVLHVAAQRGCLQLLDQVYNLFKGKYFYEVSGVQVHWMDICKAQWGTWKVEAKHLAWFACPRQVWKALSFGFSISEERIPFTQQSDLDASEHLKNKVVEIMQRETSKKAFESLEDIYKSDRNYNFVLERKELQFHFACENFYISYVKAIIEGCLALELSESVKVLTYLFQLHNAQGQTPLHLAFIRFYNDISELLELLPQIDAYKGCLNAKDVRGWTALHYVVATKRHEYLKALLQDKRVDVNARTDFGVWDDPEQLGMTALHLAILHDDTESAEQLLKCLDIDVHALFKRRILCGYERRMFGEEHEEILERRLYWSPLQLAAIMGRSDVVKALLGSKDFDIYHDEKLQNNITMRKNFQKVSALCFASASGNPDALRLFLDCPMFNTLDKFEGATALHYATNAMTPMYIPRYTYIDEDTIGPILLISDLGCFGGDIVCGYKEDPKDIKFIRTSYFGRQACITILLQAGVDIWEKDNHKRFAEPGPQAPKEAQLWWHEKMAQETLEAKKSLNDAANAIAVVAALVATASYVGPLQPPLGYEGDSTKGGVQDTHSSIRVFMVSNNLSFYLAIASILFAVVPSLPMPQEGIYDEWQRTQRTVAMAIFFLLMSVLGVLISFGAASNSVVSEEYSWQHDGLLFYPTLLGGFICILGISLFFLRLLRLVFKRNPTIRRLYRTFVRF